MAIYTFQEALEKAQQNQDLLKTSNTEVVPVTATPTQQVPESTLGTRLSERFNKLVSNTVPVITGEAKPQDLVLNAVSSGANVVGGIADILSTGVKGIVDTIAPESVKQGAEAALKDIASSQTVQDIISKYTSFKTNNPVGGELLDNAIDIGNFIATFVGGPKGGQALVKPIASAVSTAGEIAVDTAKGLIPTVKNVAQSAENAVNTAKNLATGVTDVTKETIEGAKGISRNIAANVEKIKLRSETIKQLPTEVAQIAVRDNVGLPDVKKLYSIPKENIKEIKPVVEAIQKFEQTGGQSTNPIEVVGKPIVNNIKLVNKKATEVGKELGDVAKTLPNFSKKELVPVVFENLRKVRGLEGLTLNPKGLLNFNNTTLKLAENASARKSLQGMFTQATRTGTGTSKHQLRQEIFEILGGKKKSLSNLTETEDKAYQAIRSGISDVLETANPNYAKLSNQYRKLVQPLNDLKKLIKYSAEKDGDILDMSAGLLARRLTSNAGSQSEIRQVLRNVDKLLKGNKLAKNTELSQEVYNILRKYFDISKDTSLSGEVALGVEKATGAKDMLVQAVGNVVGKTDAVRKKAIENVLKEIFNLN